MDDLASKITLFRSAKTNQFPDSTDIELSLLKHAKTDVNPLSIKGAGFAKYESNFTRENLTSAYEATLKLVYGSKIDQVFLNKLTEKVRESNRNFNYSLLLTEESTKAIVSEIIRYEKLFNGEVLKIFLEDVLKDVKNFLSITGQRECVLRLKLEDQLGLYDLVYQELSESKDELWKKVRDYVVGLGYHDSFVYHIDDYALNFTKVYCGKPSLCIATDINQAHESGFYDAWVKCFSEPVNFHEALTESLYAKDRDLSIELITQLIANINRFQLGVDSILEGVNPYQFEVGRGHYYFGLEHELNPASLLLHARPMIWGNEFSAKRFLTLIEPATGFDFKNFFK